MLSRCVVTGASGFVGGRLARRLVQAGIEVLALLRQSSDEAGLGTLEREGRFTIRRCDGSVGELSEILGDFRPDVVCHLAARFVSEHTAAELDDLVRSNILFGAALLEAMRVTGSRRIVAAGSAWQRSGPPPGEATNLYAATKRAFAEILRFYAVAEGFRVVTLFLYDTYGPDDHRPKLFRALDAASRHREEVDLSPGEQRLCLVHVDDAAEAFYVAAQRVAGLAEGAIEDWAVRWGDPVRLREIVGLYGRFRGMRVPVRWGARPYRRREVMSPDTSLAILPDWRPRYSLETGLQALLSE